MEVIAYEEAQKIWRQAFRESTVTDLKLELEIHKKLVNIFQVGDYYYFIFNCQDPQFEFVSDTVETVLGYPSEEFTLPLALERIHPDDLPWFLSFEQSAVEFFKQLRPDQVPKYKLRYDFRIKKANGEYIRVLHQVIPIHVDASGLVLHTLCLHTVISHLKQEGKPVLSFIGLEDEPSYIDVNVQNVFSSKKEILSRREKEILSLLIAGHSSHQISEKLHISTHTVNTHRKNILAKTGLSTTSELVAKAVREGWV
ncbi:hypothetical protein EFA69_06930 [Rufibacter immobilis]|uniref:HTH luxR-type domain-containing protein n=1 Tax=Rufibacter immobilis TaxID=1348778 RepID=A0A3M9MZ48_9BACT|nr:LuxR C-terminal-related transcriptional regulator [Rufibacter immobilis]RNI30832.1 hypothetical protein EFA69_06930 [Rufibacter immobilis]